MRSFSPRIPLLPLASILLVPALDASSISFVNTFTNISYEQTGNGNSLSLNGAFFSADLNTNTANPYTSATLTLPNSSTQPLPQQNPTDYGFQTGLFADLPSLQSAFPFGTYTFQGTNGATTDTTTLDYTSNDFPQSTPFLTGSDFSSLQGMNASQNITLHLNPDVPGANATDSFVFFTIFDETLGKNVFNIGFGPSNTTSVFIPGGTLTSGDQFVFEIDYSNRDILANPGGADFGPQLGFDVRTDGVFSTAPAAAPEPRSYAAVLGVALAGVLLIKRRRSAA
jgi:hypothetical protein